MHFHSALVLVGDQHPMVRTHPKSFIHQPHSERGEFPFGRWAFDVVLDGLGLGVGGGAHATFG